MISYITSKILRVITIMLGVTLLTFLLLHAVPGNPWSNYSTPARLSMGLEFDVALHNQLARRFGLDLPLWRQFTRYVIGDFERDGSFFCGAVCGNLGPSIQQGGRSVQDILFRPPRGMSFWKSPFGYSIRLVFFSALIAAGIGVPLGILSAARPRSALSRAISVVLAALMSVPNFVLGLLAIVIFASWLHLIKVLPNWNQPGSWIIPAVVLAVMPLASTARVTRASIMNVMGEDYVRAARARGLTQRRVILVHVWRNALVPVITFLGPALMELFTGLFVVEGLFAFPGFGREYWKAALALDYPMLMGLTLLYALGMALVSILVDVLAALADPRIRASKTAGAP